MTRPIRPMDVDAEVAALCDLGIAALRQRWRALTGHEAAPSLKGELLRAVLAHKLQERAFGGLRRDVAMRLAAEARGFDNSRAKGNNAASESAPSPRPVRRIKPGARLLREWQGRMHEVVVTPEGFVWAGDSYCSLSTIAKAITGTSWNGWRFFGLVERKGHAGTPATPVAGLDVTRRLRGAQLVRSNVDDRAKDPARRSRGAVHG